LLGTLGDDLLEALKLHFLMKKILDTLGDAHMLHHNATLKPG
jgi:hypothetical protein